MKTLIIIIAILLIIIDVMVFVIGIKIHWEDFFIFPLSLLNGIIIVIIINTYRNEIKPIDVYRNNTTLEITYRDSIAIDSTVIWKNK